VRGLGRYDRTERLAAAHTVLVVEAFFEALDDCLREAGLRAPHFDRDDQVLLALKFRGDGTWLSAVFAAETPSPAPDGGVARLDDDLRRHYERLGRDLAAHLVGLAVWD